MAAEQKNLPSAAEVASWNALLVLLAELTADAQSAAQIAQRIIDRGLLTTDDPCESIWAWENKLDSFFSALADCVWDPAKDPLWSREEASHGGH